MGTLGLLGFFILWRCRKEESKKIYEVKRKIEESTEKRGLDNDDEHRLMKTRYKLNFLEEVFLMISNGDFKIFLDHPGEEENAAVFLWAPTYLGRDS